MAWKWGIDEFIWVNKHKKKGNEKSFMTCLIPLTPSSTRKTKGTWTKELSGFRTTWVRSSRRMRNLSVILFTSILMRFPRFFFLNPYIFDEMGPNRSYLTLLHNWCSHPRAINITAMIEYIQINSNYTLITWWNKSVLPAMFLCHSSARPFTQQIPGRKKKKRHLEDRRQRTGRALKICHFYFPCTLTWCVDLISVGS